MKTLLITLREMSNLKDIEAIGQLVFVSSITNVVGARINSADIFKLNQLENVISYREEDTANFQVSPR